MTKEQEDSIEILENTDISTIELAKITDLHTYSIAVRNVLSMLKEKDKEIEKKDKIIYKMIDSFIDLGFWFEYCNNDDRCINDCDKCIKKYFERKVKNE